MARPMLARVPYHGRTPDSGRRLHAWVRQTRLDPEQTVRTASTGARNIQRVITVGWSLGGSYPGISLRRLVSDILSSYAGRFWIPRSDVAGPGYIQRWLDDTCTSGNPGSGLKSDSMRGGELLESCYAALRRCSLRCLLLSRNKSCLSPSRCQNTH